MILLEVPLPNIMCHYQCVIIIKELAINLFIAADFNSKAKYMCSWFYKRNKLAIKNYKQFFFSEFKFKETYSGFVVTRVPYIFQEYCRKFLYKIDTRNSYVKDNLDKFELKYVSGICSWCIDKNFAKWKIFARFLFIVRGYLAETNHVKKVFFFLNIYKGKKDIK